MDDLNVCDVCEAVLDENSRPCGAPDCPCEQERQDGDPKDLDFNRQNLEYYSQLDFDYELPED